jgi:hypothetical protein
VKKYPRKKPRGLDFLLFHIIKFEKDKWPLTFSSQNIISKKKKGGRIATFSFIFSQLSNSKIFRATWHFKKTKKKKKTKNKKTPQVSPPSGVTFPTPSLPRLLHFLSKCKAFFMKKKRRKKEKKEKKRKNNFFFSTYFFTMIKFDGTIHNNNNNKLG